jgi:formylglycine-generating enzyme required for sulfatase activity
MRILGPTLAAHERPDARGARADGRPARGRRRVAIGVHEVTFSQYRRFRPDAKFPDWNPVDERWPATVVSFVDAMRYCCWLSEQEGVSEEQMCYPPIDQIGPDDRVLDGERLSRIGYRLPTDEEWELAARASSTTRWFGGSGVDRIPEFA